MATEKFVNIGGVWKAVNSEYANIGGVWKNATTNYANIGGSWKAVPVGDKYIWACEQGSDRLYGIDDNQADLTGWPKYGGTILDPLDVACDGDYSYWACDDYVYKIAIDGTIAWSYLHPYPVLSVCVDADGYVYTGDYAGDVRKFDPSAGAGSQLLWTSNIGIGKCNALAVDYSGAKLYAAFSVGASEGRVYWMHTVNGNFNIAYYSNGTKGNVLSIAVDEGTPSIYIGTKNGFLMKISSAGYEYWGAGASLGGEIYAVRVGHGGFGYYVNGSGGDVAKFTLSTGVSVWIDSPAGEARSVAVDQFGNVYSTHLDFGTVNSVIRKNNSSGVEQWTWHDYVNSRWRGIAVSPGIKAAGF